MTQLLDRSLLNIFGVRPVETLSSTAPQATENASMSSDMSPGAVLDKGITLDGEGAQEVDQAFVQQLDQYSLEAIVETKICRFLDQIGTYYPENLHQLIIRKVEKPLVKQILRRTGGNQVHAARILGINRNTLRKKMKMYGLAQ